MGVGGGDVGVGEDGVGGEPGAEVREERLKIVHAPSLAPTAIGVNPPGRAVGVLFVRARPGAQ
ncbi:hypothetical protein GCM10017562_29390 [Streptomyces roseofulvus]